MKEFESGTLQCNSGNSHEYTIYYSGFRMRCEVGDKKIESKGPGGLCQELRKSGLKPPESLKEMAKQGLDALWSITDYNTDSIVKLDDDTIREGIKEKVSERFVRPITHLFLSMKEEMLEDG